MGILDKSVDQKEFDKFKEELLSKISILEQEVKHKATDSEEIARTAAENALEIEKKIKDTESVIEVNLKELENYKNSASEVLSEMQNEKTNLETNNQDILSRIEKVKTLSDEIIETKTIVETATSDVHLNIDKINKALSDSGMLPAQVEEIKQLLEVTKTLSSNMEGLQSHSMKRKSEIDDLYNEINGYDITNNESGTEHVDGLKDDLEKNYDELHNQADELEGKVQILIDSITENHEQQLDEEKLSFEKLIDESEKRINAVNDELTGLLPGAMAEGLSAAYEEKKDEEIESQKKLEISFKISISLLVAISLIPFSVDLYLLIWTKANLVQVIKDTPSLLVAIFPLYFPVLWFAYSSNKKMNLSKRLIEEYTHKAVLGKTFGGLSNQIETLPQGGVIRDELRTRLLFNLLQVSSENPGKLITDYDKSDHPLMEALENSGKLSDSVEALSKLPGFSVMANKLAEKSEKILKAEGEKIKNGLAVQETLEEDAEKSV